MNTCDHDSAQWKDAQKIYNMMCEVLNDREWHFDKSDDDLIINLTVNGEDIPITLLIVVDADKAILRVLSPMPAKFGKDKIAEGSTVINIANCNLIDGGFDFDVEDGSVVFRLSISFKGSLISKKALDYALDCTCTMADEFNDKFLMVSKGAMTVDQFKQSL